MSKNFLGVEPRSGNGCWVLVNKTLGEDPNCHVPARTGMLTCRHHFEYENEAQAHKVLLKLFAKMQK